MSEAVEFLLWNKVLLEQRNGLSDTVDADFLCSQALQLNSACNLWLCFPHTLKPGFYISEGTNENQVYEIYVNFTEDIVLWNLGSGWN